MGLHDYTSKEVLNKVLNNSTLNLHTYTVQEALNAILDTDNNALKASLIWGLSVTDIDDPSTELNAIEGSNAGEPRLCYQTGAAGDSYTLYVWDPADSDAENVPYTVDGSSGMWVAIGGSYNAAIGAGGTADAAMPATPGTPEALKLLQLDANAAQDHLDLTQTDSPGTPAAGVIRNAANTAGIPTVTGSDGVTKSSDYRSLNRLTGLCGWAGQANTIDTVGTKEVSQITAVADVSGSLGGTYFQLSTQALSGSDIDYTGAEELIDIWFDVDNGSAAPNTGTTGADRQIEVDISADDTAETVAAASRSPCGSVD